MTDFAIDTVNLRKVYGENIAVRGLSLQVQQGEAFGFLGPNGAGKTTSIKMLLGLANPTSGSATLLGKPVGNREARAKMGFLPEHFRFPEWLTAREFLEVHGRLYRMSDPDLRKRIPELLDLVGLIPFSNKQLRTYSKGMLQRVGLAQALLNHPSIVFLDEPTSGLDPAGRRLVRDILRDLRNQGTTVFLNSHLLSEVEVTCDRVAFIKHGEVVHLSDLKNLMEGQMNVTIRVASVTQETLAGLLKWSQKVRQEGEQITLSIQDESVLPEISRHLVNSGAALYSITQERITLEELFLKVVGTDGGL